MYMPVLMMPLKMIILLFILLICKGNLQLLVICSFRFISYYEQHGVTIVLARDKWFLSSLMEVLCSIVFEIEFHQFDG